MPKLTDRIYAVAPAWAQTIGISAFGAIWKHRRYGGSFRSEVQRYLSRDRWTALQWHEYQTVTLRSMIAHAITHVPHYRDVSNEIGLTIDDVNNFVVSDIRHLPLLGKESIRRLPHSFVSEVPSAKLHKYSTSGTSGTPLTVLMSTNTHRRVSAAYEARCRVWAGVNYRMSRAMIGGRLVVPTGVARSPYWRYNIAERQLYMSAFHISPDTAPAYALALETYRPDYLVGYASAHFFLARLIIEQGIKLRHTPRAVLTSSEKLTTEMRSTIELAYNCRVFDGYSGVENCCLASECEEHSLHVSPDVGYVELLAEDGTVAGPGEAGEIVATGFLNPDQPLIRFRTGDYARLSKETCSCGREMPVFEELVGRIEDTVVGSDGREMVRFHGLFVGIPIIKEGQVIQETLTRFRVRLVVDRTLSVSERSIIENRFAERLGPVNVEFEVVERIERGESGKFRAVISKVERLRGAAPNKV